MFKYDFFFFFCDFALFEKKFNYLQHSNRNLDTQILKCTMHGIASLVFNLRAICLRLLLENGTQFLNLQEKQLNYLVAYTGWAT